jgi:Flp pilus assembly pilin Flp
MRFFTLRSSVRAKLARDERGVAIVEYALLLALIGGIGIPAVQFVGTSVSNQFGQAAEEMAPEGQPADDGNQGAEDDGDQGNHDGDQGNGDHGNNGDNGNNDGDQNDGNHDPGNQGNGNDDGEHGNSGHGSGHG